MKTAGRRKRSTVGRLRPYWIVAILAAGALAWGAWTVARLPLFHLRSFAVTGLTRVSAAEVRARAAIDPRANIWLQDRGAIARRIEAIPYVASARVAIRPPADVVVAVTERVADGCVRDATGARLTIDAERRALENGCTAAPPITYDLRKRLDARPGAFIDDPELASLQADAHALDAGNDRYRTFAHDSFGELKATLADGIEVRFGDDGDLARKDRLIEPILAVLGPRSRTVRALDVRAPATPIVEYQVPKTSHPHPLDRL